MKKFLFTCSTVAVIASSAIAGGYNTNVGVYAGYNLADSDCVVDDAPVVGANLNTFFTKNLGARLSYERGIAADLNRGASTLDGSSDVDYNRFALNAILRKSEPWKKLRPYLLAGFGYEDYENGITRGGASCSGQWFGDLGVGASVALNDRWSLNPEVRALFKEKCETVDIVPTLGLSYAFGGGTRVVEKVVVKEKLVEKVVSAPAPIVSSCPVPTNYEDRCDNSYYVQVAAELKCPTCDKGIQNIGLLNKLDSLGYTHENYVTTNDSGTEVNRLLVGPYKCKRDAFEALCKIKEEIACDAFVYSKRK
jgi:opacity protein-like surface antigen